MFAKLASSKALLLIASVFFSAFVLSEAHVVRQSDCTPNSPPVPIFPLPIPSMCTLEINRDTGRCVCYLIFSNSPQFLFYLQAELNARRASCHAAFPGEFANSVSIRARSHTCNRFRQGPQNEVNINYLLGMANSLISACAPPGVPLLRYP